MRNSSRQFLIVFACSLLIIGFTGCDLIKAIQDQFRKPEDTVSFDQKVQEAKSKLVSQGQSKTTANPKGMKLPADVLVRVGDWSMTKKEFDRQLEALKQMAPDYDTKSLESRRMLLDEIVSQQLVVAEAERLGLQKEQEIADAVKEFQRSVLMRELIRRKTEDLTVSDEEAQAFYDERKEQLVSPVQLRVREIVVDTQQEAKSILVKILEGGDFAEIARQKSKAPDASSGGDMGFITEVPFEEMGTVLMGLDVGSVSNVFQGPAGFYLVKIEEATGGEQLAFEDIKEDIIQNLLAAKQQQFILDYIAQLKQKIDVTINESLLQTEVQK